VLHLLTALASLAEGDALRVLLTSLGHFTTAVLRASVFFYATRFISLLAAEARAAKKAVVNLLLLGLLVTNFVIFVAACAAIRDEIETGRKLLQEELRQGDFVWHLKTLATMVMLKTSIVLKLLSQCQLTSMLANVYATCRTFVLHWRETKDAGILVIWRLLKKLFLALSHLFNAALFFAVIFAAFKCIACVLFSIVLDPKGLPRRGEDSWWFLQLLADMPRVPLLTAAVALSAWLVFLTGTDVVASNCAMVTHFRVTVVRGNSPPLGGARSGDRRSMSRSQSSTSGVIPVALVDIMFLVCTEPFGAHS
ncbi:hypothetical protein MRX96_056692, partial [Rhipicephalus microplus]